MTAMGRKRSLAAYGRNGWKADTSLRQTAKSATATMATAEKTKVVHPMAFEWLHPEAAIDTSRASMPIAKLTTSICRIVPVESMVVTGGACGWLFAISTVEAITATMNDTAAKPAA